MSSSNLVAQSVPMASYGKGLAFVEQKLIAHSRWLSSKVRDTVNTSSALFYVFLGTAPLFPMVYGSCAPGYERECAIPLAETICTFMSVLFFSKRIVV